MFEWLRVDGEGGMERMIRKFEQMLEDGRHIFDAASNGLLGGVDPEVIREDLFATDERINRTEQEIRRQLVVHGAIYGAEHVPEMLVLMSVVKDAERIGDYAKNIFDLIVQRARIGAEERADLIALKDRISKLLVRLRNLYEDEDEDAARAFLADADDVTDACDDHVHRLLGAQGVNMAGEVLCYRYFKRVASHAANVASSLVMPVDKLDFFEEPKERRRRGRAD